MKQYSYYSYRDTSQYLLRCNRKCESAPVIVNCFGSICLDKDFYTSATRNDYYLLIMVEGILEVALDDKKTLIKQGDAVIFPPGFKYSYNNKKDSNIKYYWIHFTGGYVKEYLKTLNLEALKIIHGINSGEISEFFDRTYLKTLINSNFLDSELSLLVYNSLIAAAKANSGENSTNRLIKSLSYINENYTDDIPVKVLAEIENISVSRYNYIFRNQLGISPVKYITELRLNKAAQLLSSTNLSVAEISALCGFSDPHYFHKVFKKHFDTSPRNLIKSSI